MEITRASSHADVKYYLSTWIEHLWETCSLAVWGYPSCSGLAKLESTDVPNLGSLAGGCVCCFHQPTNHPPIHPTTHQIMHKSVYPFIHSWPVLSKLVLVPAIQVESSYLCTTDAAKCYCLRHVITLLTSNSWPWVTLQVKGRAKGKFSTPKTLIIILREEGR